MTEKVTKEKKEKVKKEPRKDKDVNLNFFQLSLDNLTAESENAIKISEGFKNVPNKFSRLKRDDESRISLLGDKFYVLPSSTELLYGTLIHTQTNDLPFGFDDESQKAEELPLKDGQGLGYQTSFLIDLDVNIVMIESVKNGVGIGDFCRFFENNMTLTSLDASVVINPKEINRLRNMKNITKFQVKIARLQSGSPFRDAKMSANQLVKAADDTNTDMLEVTMSSGYAKNKPLDKEKILTYVYELLKYKNKENKDVKKLIVTGKSSDGGVAIPVDLIKERLHDKHKVELVRKNNITPMDEKYKSLYGVYMNHKTMLHKAYKIEKTK